jgi:hypothetical protein
VRARLEQIVQNKKFHSYSDELMHNAKVEKLLDKPAPAQAGASTPAPKPAAETPAPAAAPAPAPAAAPAPKG